MSLGRRRLPEGAAPQKSPSFPFLDKLRWPSAEVFRILAAEEEAERESESVAPGAGIRERLSRQHIISAHHFAEAASVLESREPGTFPPEEKWQHRSYVTAAVFAASAFLEASINELYLELQRLSQSEQPQLRRELAMLPRVWPEIVRSPVLHKYQMALRMADGDQYNENRSPFCDADSLVRLGDALLSYIPEWDDRRGRHHTLEQRLHSKFPPNALAAPDAPWFPDRCLGAGCARWAVRAAQLLNNDFCHRMAVPASPLVGAKPRRS